MSSCTVLLFFSLYLPSGNLVGNLYRGSIRQWERLLGSEVFSIREEATKELIRSGDVGVIVRLHGSRDVEVRHRARQAYDVVKAKELNSLEPYPFLDSLWYDPKTKYYRYDDPVSVRLSPYLGRVVGLLDLPNYGGYRQATRLWVSDLYEMGFPVRLLGPVFKEMRKRDKIFLGGIYIGGGG